MLNDLTAGEVSRGLAAGAFRSEDVVRACLERIAAREPAIAAWAYLDPERALAAARARDREPRRGPLHGVPVAVKDNFDTDDMPTAYGSPIYAGHRPAASAATVAALRAAGAVILGKTVTTEFAALHPGKTRNPRDPLHTPGGSSSGSAAAVADMMAPLALGTQTMGSVIRPASFCGVIGMKPSFGTIPRAGIKPQSATADSVGLFARAVDDVPLLLDTLAPTLRVRMHDAGGGPWRIGICRGPGWDKAAPETEAALAAAATALAAAQGEISEIEPSAVLEDALEAAQTVVSFEMALALAHEYETYRERLSPALADFLAAGHRITDDEHRKALDMAATARVWLDACFQSVDALLTAAASGEAPRSLASTGDTVFNRAWTLLHVPCLTFPAGTGPHGLPVGLQLIGRVHGDARLIAIARWATGVISPSRQ